MVPRAIGIVLGGFFHTFFFFLTSLTSQELLVTGSSPASRDAAVCNGVPTQGNEGYAAGREPHSREYTRTSQTTSYM